MAGDEVQTPSDGVLTDNATFVDDNTGNINSGSGHQFNNPNFWGFEPERLLGKEAPKRDLTEARLGWLADRFVQPGNYERAQTVLGNSRAVLLGGAPGAGRLSAAKMLLRDLASKDTPAREIPVDTDEEARALLDPEMVREGERLLVDLSADGELRRLDLIRDLLAPLVAAVENAEGYLSIVLPPGMDQRLPTELRTRLVEIGRPLGREVLGAHLATEGFTAPSQTLREGKLDTFLAGASMEEIGQLCHESIRAHERNSARGFDDCLADALRIVSKRNEVVERLVSGKPTAERALLIAAGFVEGAHVDVVGDLADKLLTEVGQRSEEGSVLSGKALSERVIGLKLKITESHEVEFGEYSAESVLDYFWWNFPGLRPAILEWVGTSLTSTLLSDEVRNLVIRRFAKLCRESRHGADLCALASWLLRLGAARQPPRAGALAARLLSEGLEAEPGALVIRRKIYDWVTAPALPPDLARVLVLVCSGVLTQTHPEQAMVRLRHLARRPDRAVADEATEGLLGVANDDRLFAALLRRVASAAGDTEADATLFLRVIESKRLVSGSRVLRFAGVLDQLTTGWKGVVEFSRQFWAERARDWFDAFESDTSTEPLMDALVEAASQADRLGRLYVAFREWGRRVPDSEIRQRTVRLVRDKIDDAQLMRAGLGKEMAR